VAVLFGVTNLDGCVVTAHLHAITAVAAGARGRVARGGVAAAAARRICVSIATFRTGIGVATTSTGCVANRRITSVAAIATSGEAQGISICIMSRARCAVGIAAIARGCATGDRIATSTTGTTDTTGSASTFGASR